MKKIAMALLIATIGTAAHAWEHPQNPDRFPSIGLNYTGTAGTAEYKVMGFKQDVDTRSAALILDTRLPLSNSFTLSLGIGSLASNTKGKANTDFSADELDGTGGLFTIGGRYYFNR